MIVCLFSCKQNKIPVTDISSLPKKDHIRINQWRIIGPFLNKDTTQYDSVFSIEEDFMSYFGINEDLLSAHDLLKINSDRSSTKKILSPHFENSIFKHDQDHINFWKYFNCKDKQNQVVYLACVLYSNKKREVFLQNSICQGSKMWLNNQLIQEIVFKRNIKKLYEKYLPVTLQKGNNLLLIKISLFDFKVPFFHWKTVFDVGCEKYAKKMYNIDYRFDFIGNPIVENDTLALYIPPYKNTHDLHYSITSLDRSIRYVKKITETDENGWYKIAIDTLPPGLFNCKLDLKDCKFSQYFLKGRIDSLDKQINSKYQKTKHKIKNDIDINGLRERLAYLIPIDSSGYNCDKLFWRRCKVNTAWKLLELLSPPYKYQAPKRLHGYRSKIDSSIQYYLYHLPKDLGKDNPVPVLCIMPYNFSSDAPALSSFYFSNIDQIAWDNVLAEKYGMANFWPYMRGSRSTPIGEADFFEALSDLKKRYAIDSTKIYLLGDCTGGTKALNLASHHPSIFAAIATFGPITTVKNSLSPATKNQNPIDLLRNLHNIPIYILHSEDDQVSPISQSLQYIEKTKEFGFEPLFDRVKGISHYLSPKNYHSPGIQFLKNKKQKTIPDTIEFVTYEHKHNKSYWLELSQINYGRKATVHAIKNNNNFLINGNHIFEFKIHLDNLRWNKNKKITVSYNGQKVFHAKTDSNIVVVNVQKNKKPKIFKRHNLEGPVWDVFTDHFILVYGTKGSCSSDMTLRNSVKHFDSTWQSHYFSKCYSIPDTCITTQNMSSNLILFGNENTNHIISRLIDSLPLKMNEEEIMVSNKTFTGKKLMTAMIYPNPLKKNRYIVIIGSNHDDYFFLPQYDMAKNAWYDWAVFEKDNTIIKKGSGYFDGSWH